MKTISDLIPTRRDAIKLGTLSMLGAFAETAFWPHKVKAAGKSNPRGTAKYCIVFEAAGAISHIDTFDFKENEGSPKDLDIRPSRVPSRATRWCISAVNTTRGRAVR
jgi:hypothetical protein